MQNSNIDLSDKRQLTDDDNITVLASSASSSELSTGLEVSQNEKLGYSEVFWHQEQNSIVWINGHSSEFEIFLDEQQRITIVDVRGTKLRPEDVTVFKFKDKDIYLDEIEAPSTSQIIADQIELSNLATFERELSNDQVLTLDNAVIANDDEELILQHQNKSLIDTNYINLEQIIEGDTSTILEKDDTENTLFDQLISGTDLFGADLASIPIDNESLWHSPLSENVFFDTALVYSSHEFISLKDGKKLYDDSPIDSLIFVNEGPSDLVISEKKADIFLEADSSTSITGANSNINLFQTTNAEAKVKLSGDFSKLSLNLYQGDGTEIPEARIVEKRLFIDESESKSIDLSEINYGSSIIEFNIYNNEGLVDSQSLQYDKSFIDALDIAPAASPDVVGENVNEILFDEYELPSNTSEILFEDEVEIVRLDHGDPNHEFVPEIDQNISRGSSEPHFSMEIAQQVEELITEPTNLLEAGQLFADPLDVFDDSDFS